MDNIVECDEVYIVAGHKGQHDEVLRAGREPRRRRLKGKPGRGTAANDKPPVFGMISRSGQLAMELLPNVKKQTIKPHVLDNIKQGSLIYTDEYVIYGSLEDWGFYHKTVNHGRHEYARDDDGDLKFPLMMHS